jgi:hypothetical protein
MKNTNLFSIIGLLATASLGYGSLIAPRSVLNLEQNADLIVVGAVSGISQAGPTTTFSLLVSRVLKGDSNLSGNFISVGWMAADPSTPQVGVAAAAGGTGIWFLQGASGAWALLPVVQGSVPLAMTYFPAPSGPILSAYNYDASATLSDKVAAELGSAIESGGGAYTFQLYALQYGLLDKLNSPYTSVLYQRISTSTSIAQQIIGLSGLIRGGSAGALSSAIQAVPAYVGYPKENGILLLSVRDYFRAVDANSIAVLGQTAVDSANPNSALREAVAHALAAIHTTATLPYLATLLGDEDVNLQAEAVGGIGSFANGLPIQTSAGVPSLAYLQFPASAPYMNVGTKANFALGPQAIGRNGASYLSFWGQWWLQNRASLGF